MTVCKPWIITADLFGTPVYAMASNDCPFTDNRSESAVYDHRDDKDTKRSYFAGLLKSIGGDGASVKVMEL